LSRIGIKPSDKTVGKGVIRIQKLVDELNREISLLKARVKKLESS
tara:strand:+ start:495 stop:629 length:135 start_codon:yes stop_codon:yes gene_type:complete